MIRIIKWIGTLQAITTLKHSILATQIRQQVILKVEVASLLTQATLAMLILRMNRHINI
jgi:hypothetical protein